MKMILTKKEVNKYMEIVNVVLKPYMSEKEYEEVVTVFEVQLKEGIKNGAITCGFNKKMQLIYTIDPNFVSYILEIFSKYLVVVIPQIMSIMNLTKNLISDINTEENKYFIKTEEKE